MAVSEQHLWRKVSCLPSTARTRRFSNLLGSSTRNLQPLEKPTAVQTMPTLFLKQDIARCRHPIFPMVKQSCLLSGSGCCWGWPCQKSPDHRVSCQGTNFSDELSLQVSWKATDQRTQEFADLFGQVKAVAPTSSNWLPMKNGEFGYTWLQIAPSQHPG